MGFILDTAADPDSMTEDFLPEAWRHSIKSIKSPDLQTANHEVVDIEGIVSLVTHFGDLHLHAWLEIS